MSIVEPTPAVAPGRATRAAVNQGMIGWMALATIAAVIAWRYGAAPNTAALAAALAIVPALITLMVSDRFDEAWTLTTVVAVWTGAAAIGAALSGGATSPLSAVFLIAPAVMQRLGQFERAAEGAMFGAIFFAVAGLWAAVAPKLGPLDPLPALLAIGAIAISGLLFAGRRFEAARAAIVRAPVAAPAPPPPKPPADPAADVARGQRMAELSHELRTPLGHIMSYADMMRQGVFGPLNDKYAEYAELIHKSGGNLLELINRLMDFSRMEAGRYTIEKETFDLRDIVREVVRLTFDAAAARRIEVRTDLPAAPLMVQADPVAMRQVLMNLVTNALKFTPEAGYVGVLASRGDGKDVRIEVEDDGPGIPPEDRQRLTRAFERGTNSKDAEGVGLGLALASGFVELHDGALTVDESAAGGARMIVSVPIGV